MSHYTDPIKTTFPKDFEDRVDALEESYQEECKLHKLDPDTLKSTRRYIFFLLTILKARQTGED